MKVYLLWHDDHDYESGPMLRGVFGSYDDAMAELPIEGYEIAVPNMRTGEGPHCRTEAHTYEGCCSIEETKVRAPIIRGLLADRPMTGSGGALIPASFVRQVHANLIQDGNSLRVALYADEVPRD